MPSWLRLTRPDWQLSRTLILTHTLTLLLGTFVGYETHRSIGLLVLLTKLAFLGGAGYGAIWVWAQASSRLDTLRGNWPNTKTLTSEANDEEV